MRGTIDLSAHPLAPPASPPRSAEQWLVLHVPQLRGMVADQRLGGANFRRLTRLFDAQGGLCHWCGVAMILEWLGAERQPSRRHATIDHLWDRFDPRRYAARRANTPVPKVAACRRCNAGRCDRRTKEMQIAHPEHLRERSGLYGVERQRAALGVGVLEDASVTASVSFATVSSPA